MRTALLRRRAIRVEQARRARETERCLRCLAADLAIDPEALRGEAVTLHERFAEAGAVTNEDKLRIVALELNAPVEDVRREVEEVLARCERAATR